MDYMIKDPNLGDIVIEGKNNENKEEAKKNFERRMLTYYTAFMAPLIKSKLDDGAKLELLIKIVGTLTEEEISQRVNNLGDESQKNSYISVLQELVDAYEDENLDEYQNLDINGNKFTVKKGLDVSSFYELFESIGNETQGNKWMVEIDSEGKVVLHE